VTASGSLHIRDTVTDDGFARFYCQTVHRLTGEKRLSMPGQIIVNREWQRYVLVPLETVPAVRFLSMLVSGRKCAVLLSVLEQITRAAAYCEPFVSDCNLAERLLKSKRSQSYLLVPTK
jgi:hypothetical protein